MLVACARAYYVAINDVVAIIDFKIDRGTWAQGARQIDSHQCADDRVIERVSRGINYRLNIVSKLSFFHILNFTKLTKTYTRRRTWLGARPVERFAQLRNRIVTKSVLIKLQPEIVERVGGIVLIGNRFSALNAVRLFIQYDFDIVIDFLLPVLMTRLPRRVAVDVGRRQNFV